ncbi:SRPBCC family protein [Actinomadura barringtoniae]|uniref:SRPBCC family protein n=1 Tax=Actinomadura barringtoniae TaxID=1427535 RepID=A0A939PQT8_9ACTN|nr:SRPBCC family protein [Actinomadura barringtoniae]MBO2453046.1 SRPBCC family protein [Actinomadura barringtoniae]
MIDVTEQINAVRRRVGARMMEAGEARTITISQTYDAELDDVWDAITSPERISRWFLPVSGELRLGGRYAIEGNASGTIERCDPPKSFFATWEFGGDTSWIEVSLSPAEDGRTVFQLEHIAHVDDERWTEFGPGAVGIGWDMGLIGLYVHLTGGQELTSEEGAAWAGSDEGKAFMTDSNERWREADVASGTDPGDAKARADRTIAAYTAAPPAE